MAAKPLWLTVTSLISLISIGITSADGTTEAASPAPTGDESALMNIWNYQIERKVKAMIKYKLQDLAVWEEVETADSPAGTRRYYVTPPATVIPSSAVCQYVAITHSFEVTYDVQLWEKDLPSATVAGLKELGLEIREDQIHPLPFYQARVIWNNPEQELYDLKLSSAWINNLKQEQAYRFRVAAANNQSCQLLVDTIRQTPEQFIDSVQLQFTVAAAKIDSRVVNVKSEHVTSSQLVAALQNMPGLDGPTRYLTSNDYNRMLWQISNQVLVDEVTSGDYVDADDEISLKDVVAQMFQTQKENTAEFDEKMWNSVFWDPLDERPDKITSELNKVIYINETDHRAYTTGSSSSSAKVSSTIAKIFGATGSHAASSSVTTDDLSHSLEELGIDSEVQGEKFIPKALDLQRLNMNDLTRRVLFGSKRIRVKQVDIGGVLQIGVGSKSSAEEAEDENRRLRGDVADLRKGLADARNEISDLRNSTQSDIARTRDDFSNTLTDSLANLMAVWRNTTLEFTATCTSYDSPHLRDCRGDARCLDIQEVRCPERTVLSHFQLHRERYMDKEGLLFYSYTCCTLI